jgi:hypothetical protein
MKLALFCLLLGLPGLSHSAAVRGLLGIHGEFGGEKLFTVTYSDGSTSDVTAGEGLSIYGGAIAEDLAPLGAAALDLQASAGLKYSTVREATNGGADFFRYPLELLAFVRYRPLRVGLGPAYHVGGSFAGNGVLSPFSFELDPALGLVAQADYLFGRFFNLGLRYTSIRYRASRAGAGSVDASNLGVTFAVFFP